MRYKKSTLDNGIRVVSAAIPNSRASSVGVLVEAGPFSEESDQGGLAHLCEHLLFQGTSSRSALDIANMMDGAGGQVGGATSRDYTCYYALTTDDYTTYALDLLGDVLLNPIFPQAAVESEKRAICCEIEGREDDPAQHVHHLLKENVWAGNPLGRSITGTRESVECLTREDLIYFLHCHYQPERIVLAGAGNLDHEDFVAHVRDAFWRMIPSNIGPRPSQPALFCPGLALRPAPISQAYFSLAFEAPSYTAENRYSVHLLARLLGGGLSSRLHRRLRDEKGLVYDVHASYQAYKDGGLLMIEGATVPPNLVLVLSEIFDELTDLGSWRRPATEDELMRAKAQLRAQIILSGEDSHSLMSRLATQELYFGHYLPEEDLLAGIDHVCGESLKKLVTDDLNFSADKAALAVVAPEAPADYDSAILLDLLQRQELPVYL